MLTSDEEQVNSFFIMLRGISHRYSMVYVEHISLLCSSNVEFVTVYACCVNGSIFQLTGSAGCS